MASLSNYSIVNPAEVSNFAPATIHTEKSNAWPDLSDQRHARKIAEEKLRRQNERITQTDQVLAAISSSKPKRRSRAKAWKPLDLTESSDEHADSDDQAGPGAFYNDDYAKKLLSMHLAYQPYNSSRYSQDTMGMYQVPEYEHWQYVTRNTKAHASGLNAYQIQLDVSTPTVAASYNKHEINDVFGNELPSPSYCTANTGGSNGQVQFCIHPNGDVSAHQWSGSLYQWINIGQYSNIRKKTEGQMANERLIGETETQSLQQNTLAYFRLVAKQREAQVTGNALAPKEIQSALSSSHARNVKPYSELTNATQGETSTPGEKLNSFGTTSNKTKTRITSHETLHKSPTPSPYVSRNDHSSSSSGIRSRLADLKFGSMPASQPGSRGPQSRTYSTPDFAPNNLASAGLERSTSFPTQTERQRSGSYMSHLVESPMLLEGSPFDTYFPSSSMTSLNSRRSELTEPRDYYTGPSFMPAVYAESQSSTYDYASRYDKSYLDDANSRISSAGRGTYKDMLQKTADSATARGSSVTQKTLLEQLPEKADDASKVSNVTKSIVPMATQLGASVNFKAAFAPPGLNKPTGPRSELLEGTETEGSWTRRPVDVVTVKLPPMANEDLALHSRPTPQNFEGPFFQGLTELNDTTNNQERHDQQLSEWFHSGKVKAERHDDLFGHIMAQANSADLKTEAATPSRDPGVIGGPKTSATAVPNIKPEPKFNETLTRLLIPVIENLKFFVEGPESTRRGWDARFVTSPEWCVDKSEKGNLSFFEKEWVQPPKRIGRDQRFTVVKKDRFRGRMALDF
ncbi:hypothetical protein MBLNU457_g2751t1 [Dothideomycetes sp. NU457]